MKVAAVLSMLHEGAESNSSTRAFFDQPVLGWTIQRLKRASKLESILVLSFADQAESIRAAGGEPLSIGPRRQMPQIDAIAAARRWSDGWRGGLLSSSEFDLGFDGRSMLSLIETRKLDALLLVNPAAAMIDPTLVDTTIDHADQRTNIEYAFVPAAPGFGMMLLRAALLSRLADASVLPGRLVAYQPDAPMRDPLGSESCVTAPLPIVRSPRRFTLDCQHQIEILSSAWQQYRDDLPDVSAERLCAASVSLPVDQLPRDVTLEITTRRLCRPIFSPISRRSISRGDLSPELLQPLFDELANRDDARITFAGVGDAALHPKFSQILRLARRAGVASIHVETDLLVDDEALLGQLLENIDVLSIHIPAVSAGTYAALMGQDRLDHVMQNLTRLVAQRQRAGSLPIIAPTFVKTRQNLAEMEAWYDQWLRALGTAVIAAPGDFGGMMDDVRVGDMSGPARVPCRRIASRVTVLSDGSIVSCEEDLLGRRKLGQIGIDSLAVVWKEKFGALRAAHADRRWDECGPCANCREWHRP